MLLYLDQNYLSGMAELIRRARLHTWCGCELFTGRRPDVDRLRGRLEGLLRERRDA